MVLNYKLFDLRGGREGDEKGPGPGGTAYEDACACKMVTRN